MTNEELLSTIKFPSPTGVNYYESKLVSIRVNKKLEFPSPTGVNYYELFNWIGRR